MRYLSAAHTDTGLVKKINQDAFCLKIAKTPQTQIALVLICDGMGGLKNGELASAWVVNAYSAWFEKELPGQLEAGLDGIKSRLESMALELNQKIGSYGKHNGISLGTTMTGLLLLDNKYLYFHVGDSRIYRINTSIRQLTRDHTVTALEVEKHKITEQEAANDARQSILLQCIGASEKITVEFGSGIVAREDVFLLCSDGFRHKLSEEELLGILSSQVLTSEKIMKKSLMDLVELNKERGETDNITALLVKAIQ